MRAGSVIVAECFDDVAYTSIVERSADALIYHSPQFLRFLSESIPSAQFRAFLVSGRAALPAMIMRTSQGTVLNSLPYFGSHGDFVVTSECQRADIKHVAQAMSAFCEDEGIDAINIVSHPCHSEMNRELFPALSAWDHRLGQLSPLTAADSRLAAMEQTLAACSGKARNLARKGLRGGFVIRQSVNDSDWAELARLHRLGIEALGGRPKSLSEFLALRNALGDSCKLYTARRDGLVCGVLLMLYYRDWVEYFTPASDPAARQDQVIPALVAEAMVDARLSGANWWNWGGTWASQRGVRHFKAGWGAQEFPYTYWGGLLTDQLRSQMPDALAAAFPRFYVRPFVDVSEEKR